MSWKVSYSRDAAKQQSKLPERIKRVLDALVFEIQKSGPVRGDWLNYGKLGNDLHHCHLKKGHPTYVAVWQMTDKTIKLVEIQYAGTHEKAPY